PLDQLVCRPCDLDHTVHAMGLHAAGHIHRVTPDVIFELAAADHARNQRAGVDADPETHAPAALKRVGGHVVTHLERHVDKGLCMVEVMAWQAGDGHVA